jgi:murein L,D-transpeptidase YcbB/YkuD
MGLALAAVLALSACDNAAQSRNLVDSEIVSRTLQAATTHGFGANLFPPGTPRESILAYAKAQRGVDRAPTDIDANWGMKVAPYDAEAALQQALDQDKLQEWVDGLRPAQPEYEALRQAYVRYQGIAQAGGWPQVPAGPALSIGSEDPRVALLRQRLTVENGVAEQASTPFDQALAQTLGSAQTRYGLPATGKLDEPTRAALNVPVAVRLQQMQANLQRWRWAPQTQDSDRIEVNVAAGNAVIYMNSKPAMQMRVAVGRPGNETPMLVSNVHTVVLNPTWTVPESIAKNELLPKEQANPGYLARRGFSLDQTGDTPRLVQEPSAQNALGLVKFQFDNKFSVYLHDTPAKAAFAQSQRSVSHGCVRLERAVDFAKLVLARDGWDAARVDSVIAGGKTTNVKLSAPFDVRLYYWTAWVENGQVQFRRDVYGWDYPTAQLANGVVAKPKPAAVSATPATTVKLDLALLEDILPSETSRNATYEDYYTDWPDTPPAGPERKGSPGEDGP